MAKILQPVAMKRFPAFGPVRAVAAKWLLLLCFLHCISSGEGNAQSREVALGLVIGQSHAELLTDAGEKSAFYDMRAGLHLGIQMACPISKSSAFVSGLEYVSGGGQLDLLERIPEHANGSPAGVAIYANMQRKVRLQYLELPLMYRYTFGRNYKFQVNAGLFVGLLMGGRVEKKLLDPWYFDGKGQILYSLTSEAVEGVYDITGTVHRFNGGLTAGVGHFFPIGNSRISYDLRFSVGTVNIQKAVAETGRNYTGCLFLDLSYSYNFRRLCKLR